MKILTWHVHGNYLLYLTKFSPHVFYLPVDKDGNGGRGATMPFGANVVEIAAEDVRNQQFDVILYQHWRNWLEDQHRLLSDEQMRGARIFLEHDPPREHPVDQPHFVGEDKNVLLVHCTDFNALMWNSGKAATRVIEHGVFLINEATANFSLPKGVTAINTIAARGRRAGADLFLRARETGVALDLVGMEAEKMGGVGEIKAPNLPAFLANYRFYFNASRYTSLNLAMIEAMLVGLPIAAAATTEVAATICNGANGFAETNFDTLCERMRELTDNPKLARELGDNARRYAVERFDIRRFTDEWNAAFKSAAG